MPRLLPRSDRAASETVGTMVGVASVVTVVALIATTAVAPDELAQDAGTVDVVATPPQGTDRLLLTRAGGASVDLGDVVVLVWRDGALWHEARAGPAGSRWAIGETIDVALPDVVPPDAPVAVTLVTRPPEGASRVVAEVTLAPRPPRDAALGPALIPFPGGDGVVEVNATESVRANAVVLHPGGRKLVLAVSATLPGLASPILLRDDGTGGDEVAGDGHYAGYFPIPVDAHPGRYPLLITATDVHGGASTALTWVEVQAPREGETLAEPVPTSSPEASPEGAPDASPDAPSAAGPDTTTSTAPSTTTRTSTSAPPPPPTPSFSILPSGGVTPLCQGDVRLQVMGVQLTYGPGGPAIPVRVDFTRDNGASLAPLFGNAPVREGRNVSFADVPSGAVIGIRGRADYASFHAAYMSYVADPHVAVLKDGDRAPAVAGFDGQRPVASYLRGYVTNGTITLEPHQAIILYEFNPNLNSTAADFQDLVVLLEFPPGGCPHVAPPGPGPVAFPATSTPSCSQLPGGTAWREIKVEPPREGVFTNGATTVTLRNLTGKTFDWAGNAGLDAVFVQGGWGGSYLYGYDPESRGQSGLTTPGDAANPIRRISFCYDP